MEMFKSTGNNVNLFPPSRFNTTRPACKRIFEWTKIVHYTLFRIPVQIADALLSSYIIHHNCLVLSSSQSTGRSVVGRLRALSSWWPASIDQRGLPPWRLSAVVVSNGGTYAYIQWILFPWLTTGSVKKRLVIYNSRCRPMVVTLW